MTIRKLAPNVWAFLDRAGDLYAAQQLERWRQQMHCECLENELESPIEDLFWIAVMAMLSAEYFPVNPDPDPGPDGTWKLPKGAFCIYPQVQIGRFRVDFLLQFNEGIPVIVELDGHDFHDKDKAQRAYEKARDRFLTAKGNRVLHFTGSEVVADPFKVVHEVLLVMGIVDAAYDPNDPLAMGIA